jgi:thioredoxin reductase (NADPH)
MSPPIILIDDDEPQVLNAIERDLCNHYRDKFRIVNANSARQGMEAVDEFKQRNFFDCVVSY